jgi:hypothetical protein
MPQRRAATRLGTRTIDDKALLEEVESLQSAIETWARRRRLWHDTGFSLPFVHARERPRIGEVLRLSYEGPLYDVFSGGHRKADAIMKSSKRFWRSAASNLSSKTTSR